MTVSIYMKHISILFSLVTSDAIYFEKVIPISYFLLIKITSNFTQNLKFLKWSLENHNENEICALTNFFIPLLPLFTFSTRGSLTVNFVLCGREHWLTWKRHILFSLIPSHVDFNLLLYQTEFIVAVMCYYSYNWLCLDCGTALNLLLTS